MKVTISTGVFSLQNKPNDALYTPSSSMQRSYQDFEFHKNDTTLPHTPKPVEPSLCKCSYFFLLNFT